MHADLPHVVIVGGGFGGLYAAKGLARARVRITLIDKHSYHMFRPLMYQVATGLLSADDVAPPLRGIFRGQLNIDVRMGDVTGIDTQSRIVHRFFVMAQWAFAFPTKRRRVRSWREE
jgi:NADH:ubiquinone reductase (H+-translocating)